MKHTGLAVLEARWWSDGNDSVRPLFEALGGIIEGNPHSVRYDMFVDESSLTSLIRNIANSEYHSLYVASHGDENSISGLESVKISRTKLRNILKSTNSNGNIKGIYFGSCLIGTAKNAAFWLERAQATGLEWVAGYNKSVDWIDSSAIDLIFWSKYLYERKLNRSRRKGKKSEMQMVQTASSEMKKLLSTAFNMLGFNIYYLDTGGALATVW